MTTQPVWDELSQFADRLETITYLRRGQTRGITIPGVLRRHVTLRREDRDDGWSGADAVWHIPEHAVAGGLRPGDRLIDAMNRHWTVLVVSPTASGRVMAWTRDWSASFSAARTVDVEKADIVQGESGEPIVRWRTVAAAVPAEFVSCQSPPVEASASNLPVYRVLVLWDGPPGRYRIKTDDGHLYSVLKMERPALPGHPAVVYLRPDPEDSPAR
jgi:hypothetical protein